jgi:hypothetical protein
MPKCRWPGLQQGWRACREAAPSPLRGVRSLQFAAPSAVRLKEPMPSDLGGLDILCGADQRHPHHRASCVAAVGIDDRGGKHPHPLALIAGATENAACGAGADRKSLIAHGFDAALLQPFIIDGSKRSPRPSVAQPHAGPALPGFGRQVIARRCAPHRCINSIGNMG